MAPFARVGIAALDVLAGDVRRLPRTRNHHDDGRNEREKAVCHDDLLLFSAKMRIERTGEVDGASFGGGIGALDGNRDAHESGVVPAEAETIAEQLQPARHFAGNHLPVDGIPIEHQARDAAFCATSRRTRRGSWPVAPQSTPIVSFGHDIQPVPGRQCSGE